MSDPLAEVVALLQPQALYSKVVAATSPWAVRRTQSDHPFYIVLLEGSCHLIIEGRETLTLHEGDFVLIPAARPFATASVGNAAAAADTASLSPVVPAPGGARVGDPAGPVDTRLLVGHCAFGSPDAALLVPLLPDAIVARGQHRLATLVQLVDEETRADRPARDVVLARLLEVLLIEALRSAACGAACESASPGLARGLGDARLAGALRSLHERPMHAWTVGQLAQEAALSRTAFFERFSRAVGVTPMDYLLAWRMALAKRLLREQDLPVAHVAERVGYGSASTFGAAFVRHVGMSPARYARTARAQPAAAGADALAG